MQPGKLIIVRHGETDGYSDRFIGWSDAPLNERGHLQALEAAAEIKKLAIPIDVCYSSCLQRSLNTLRIILEHLDRCHLCVKSRWRLNERHYGALQGCDRNDIACTYGEQQVLLWRTAWDIPPPALDKSDPRWSGHQPPHSRPRSPSACPTTESLSDCFNRVLPIWADEIAPALRAGRNVLLVSHGNPIRAIVQRLEALPRHKVLDLPVPIATPLVYEFDAAMRPLRDLVV
eukprot:Gregarina_sp_Pseudo_9__1146@NODE_1754_length_1351_cov_10_289634_g1627_i0_p1_GENE_NODE_1754_length_1351_cov_10_289634_g1627_i0NODE_1754_length_1351_cov_10_289634_g1627_i0_p1_ORF_typecomplete_len231_score54_68His_Phos_1/PF00300_22/1_3e39_NODE_1754_length_1351_cov_10_289634_g1627_i062754